MVIFIIPSISNITLAESSQDVTQQVDVQEQKDERGFWQKILDQANSFFTLGKENGKNGDLASPSEMIYNVLFALGTIITVIIGGILGIHFMIASAEDKAKIKEALVPYILGTVVIYGAFGIWKLVVLTLNNIV